MPSTTPTSVLPPAVPPTAPPAAPATTPALGREELGRLYRARLSKGRATLGELFGGHIEVASEGAWVTTSTGERFLNCGGYGVFLMGARHPTVIRHVAEQLATHPVATRLFLEPQVALAADALVSVAPPGLERVHFAGSGAEAAETAIKLARTRGHHRLIAMENGYHGKTMGALSLTGKSVFQDPFRPLLPQTSHVPYGDAVALESLLATAPGEACVFIEPVQGEAGVVIPPAGYLRAVRELCDRYGAFLVLDEIQTGLGGSAPGGAPTGRASPPMCCSSARGSAGASYRCRPWSPPGRRSGPSTGTRICTRPRSPGRRWRWPPYAGRSRRCTRTTS